MHVQAIGVRGLAALVALSAPVLTAAAGTPLTTTRVASGLVRPIFVTHAPDDSRLFIIEKQGRIRILKDGALLATPFLDIDAIVTGGTSSSSEQGLLGLAFHPEYESNGTFFVYYTAVAGSGDTVVAKYTVSTDPDVANATGDVILTFDQPQSNHNGGWIGFGPDGYLYIATGDGGGAGDVGTGHTEPGGNAQDLTNNKLGKMLRIDVNGDDFPGDANRDYSVPVTNPFVGTGNDAEIWAFGLRNPWRNSFDRQTGDLWIADVGQNQIEEVNFQPARSEGGEHYGWRCREGNNVYNNDSVCIGQTFTFPIQTYTHALGCSITGGYVYRGCAIPDLQGTYFYADYCTARIWSLRYDGTSVSEFTERTAELAPGGGLGISGITSFGEDANGEIYICDQTGGEVFKIVPTVIVDKNGNGVPDSCESSCPADFNGDGEPNVQDFTAFRTAYLAGDMRADYNGSGSLDVGDFTSFRTAYLKGCP